MGCALVSLAHHMNKIALSIEVDAVDSVRSCNMYKGQRCVALFRNLIVAWIAAPLPSQCCRILSKEHMVRSYAIVCVGRRRGQATVPFNSLHSFKIDFSGVVIFFCLVLSRFCFFFFRSVRIESGGKRSVWSRIGNVDLVFLYINTRIRSFRWESNFWASTQFGVCLSKARYNSNFGVMSMQSLSLCGGIWMNWMRHMKQWMTRAMIYTKLSYIYFYGKANSSIQNGDTSTS